MIMLTVNYVSKPPFCGIHPPTAKPEAEAELTLWHSWTRSGISGENAWNKNHTVNISLPQKAEVNKNKKVVLECFTIRLYIPKYCLYYLT